MISTEELRRWIYEIELDPTGTDRVSLGQILEACDYKPTHYDADWTVVYYNARWNSRLTFDVRRPTIPRSYLLWITGFIRGKLDQETEDQQ